MLRIKGELIWVQSEKRKHTIIWTGEVVYKQLFNYNRRVTEKDALESAQERKTWSWAHFPKVGLRPHQRENDFHHQDTGKFAGLPEPKLVYSHQATGDNPPGHRQAKAGGQVLLSPDSSTECADATADMRSGTHASVHLWRVMVKWSTGLGPVGRSPRDSMQLVQNATGCPVHIQYWQALQQELAKEN